MVIEVMEAIELANSLKDNNKGQFLSNIEVNPKEQCNAITLRSGKQVAAEKTKLENENSEEIKISAEEKKIKGSETECASEKKSEGKQSELEQKPMYKPPLRYPRRFKKKTLDEQFLMFLEIFKKIHINILFVDALEQMPNYAKFINEVMSKKRRLQENEVVNLIEKALELGEMKPISITLQLVDRSIKYPRGMVEYVLMKLNKFIFSADFVIMDMEEDHATPLIFGRPFFATNDAKIEVKKGEFSMGVEDKRLIFNIFKKAPNTPIKELCLIERVVKLKGCIKAIIEDESPKKK
ncbi:uncharacterized protein [Henckelia pumila]|uniref:uncharacterized protein n=1 Tax=Henckelia pumila TaxID=405737 RepID=UPI003C6E748F